MMGEAITTGYLDNVDEGKGEPVEVSTPDAGAADDNSTTDEGGNSVVVDPNADEAPNTEHPA